MTRAAILAMAAIGCHLEANGMSTGEAADAGTPTRVDAADTLVLDDGVLDTSVVNDVSAEVDADERYFPLEGARNWYASRDACKERGGHLATVTTAAEFTAIKKLSPTDTWLGLRKSGDTGVFEWITGEPFLLDGWKPGEPNGTGSCGKMSDDGAWLDHSCLEPLPALCEHE